MPTKLATPNYLFFFPLIDKINRNGSFRVSIDADVSSGDINELNQFFLNIDQNFSNEHLYSWLEMSNPRYMQERAYRLILKKGNVNIKLLSERIRLKRNIAIGHIVNLTLEGFKDFYVLEDIQYYKDLHNFIEQYFRDNVTKIFTEKSFFVTSEVWLCEKCNQKQETHQSCSCGWNVDGLSSNTSANYAINELQSRIIVLERIFSENKTKN